MGAIALLVFHSGVALLIQVGSDFTLAFVSAVFLLIPSTFWERNQLLKAPKWRNLNPYRTNSHTVLRASAFLAVLYLNVALSGTSHPVAARVDRKEARCGHLRPLAAVGWT